MLPGLRRICLRFREGILVPQFSMGGLGYPTPRGVATDGEDQHGVRGAAARHQRRRHKQGRHERAIGANVVL